MLISSSTRIRVSSTVLAQCSRVFKAMFSDRFQEGIRLASLSKIEKELPDDGNNHGMAMLLMCKVMHQVNHSMPHTLGEDEVVDLACMVDKYECQEALRFAAHYYTFKHKDCDNSMTRAKLTNAAALFGNKKLFADIRVNEVLLLSPGTIFNGLQFYAPGIRNLFGT